MSCGCGRNKCNCGNSGVPGFVGGCGSNKSCGTGPSTVLPYYQDSKQCKEDHSKIVNNYLYDTTIRNDNSWNIPACGQTVTIVMSNMTSILVGSNIWNPNFGYFEVIAFDSVTKQLTLINNCDEGNALPGTQVEACSEFIVTDTGSSGGSSDGRSCVEIDFTAPSVNTCILITVTSLGSIQAGDTVRIGSGVYRVSNVDSETTIQICNDGDGITPGTPVIAKNSAGQYQYCLVVISNCCAVLSEQINEINEEIDDLSATIGTTITNVNQLILNFGGIPGPCSNYKNAIQNKSAGSSLATVTPVTVNAESSAQSPIVSLTVENSSDCRTMQVFTIYHLQVRQDLQMDAFAQHRILRGFNAGPLTYVLDQGVISQIPDWNTGDNDQNNEWHYYEQFSLPPGGSTQINFRMEYANPSEVNIPVVDTGVSLRVFGIAV